MRDPGDGPCGPGRAARRDMVGRRPWDSPESRPAPPPRTRDVSGAGALDTRRLADARARRSPGARGRTAPSLPNASLRPLVPPLLHCRRRGTTSTGRRSISSWNFVRNPNRRDWSLGDRPGSLRLRGSAVSLDEVGRHRRCVARRQQHFAHACLRTWWRSRLLAARAWRRGGRHRARERRLSLRPRGPAHRRRSRGRLAAWRAARTNRTPRRRAPTARQTKDGLSRGAVHPGPLCLSRRHRRTPRAARDAADGAAVRRERLDVRIDVFHGRHPGPLRDGRRAAVVGTRGLRLVQRYVPLDEPAARPLRRRP